MKTAMKLTTGILAITMTAGAALAQAPDAIDNARSTVKTLQQQANAPAAKPAPGAPAPAVKAAAIPGSKAAAKPAAASSASNQLKHVNVTPGADGVQIEISSSQAVTPKVSKLSSPARVLVELPETVVASAQTKITVGSAGVKGVRIGMDGKNPPTTSVVVDLDQPMAYDVTPGADGKVVLSLHAQGAATAKSSPAPSAPAKATAVKTVAAKAAAPAPAPAKVATAKAPAPAKAEAKTAAKAEAKPAKAEPVKTVATAKATAKPVDLTEKPANKAGDKPADKKEKKPEEKKWAMNGSRDPFFSPVVQQQGSGCSTGKKCLEIGNINLRGVVKSDTGFIAVVTNNLNKAYFLRENDPVFNGYVVKITGDSVTFQETVQDKLGKAFTREVVKKIFTPAV